MYAGRAEILSTTKITSSLQPNYQGTVCQSKRSTTQESQWNNQLSFDEYTRLGILKLIKSFLSENKVTANLRSHNNPNAVKEDKMATLYI